MIALTVRQLQQQDLDKTFPMNIHGRVYQTQEEYDEAFCMILSMECN